MSGAVDRTVTHHPDCDGWVTAHYTHWTETARTKTDGIGHWTCEDCDWRDPDVGDRPRRSYGVYGPHHSRQARCDGQCQED